MNMLEEPGRSFFPMKVSLQRSAVVAACVVSFGAGTQVAWSQCDGMDVGQLLASDGASDDQFGVSVSVSGDVAVIGAHLDDDNGTNSGAAYVYRFNGVNWVQEQKLMPSDGAAADVFGASVAVSKVCCFPNGSCQELAEGECLLAGGEPQGDVAVVGALGNDDNGTDSGSVYVFRFNGSTWVQEQKLTAFDGAAADVFGFSVAVSGDVAVIGAVSDDDNGANSGSAYVFRFDGSNWIEEQKLLPPDGAPSDLFGWSVAVSGNVAVVGSRFDDDNGTDSGSSYVYRFDGSSWLQEQKLLPLDGASGDRFGDSVAISGNVAVIGAYLDDDSGFFDSGSAYVFRFNGSLWLEEAKLTASDGFSGDQFGSSVGLAGDVAVIGAPNSDANCNWPFLPECGVAYLFSFDGSTWSEQATLMEPEPGLGGDHFGNSVAVSGGVILVGSFSDTNPINGNNSGSAYAFTGECAPSGCTLHSDCDDLDACTSDVCSGGVCLNTPINCNDGNLCTTDGCNPSSGCVNAPASCNDGDACTSDACEPASGCSHQPMECPAGETCVDGICNDVDICDGDDASGDADADGVCADIDNCKLFNPDQLDCQPNGVGDVCDIADGTSSDNNGDGVPDECDSCLGNLNGDDVVDAADLAILLGSWGPCPGCPADISTDGTVDASDLAILLGNWGPCA